MNSWHTIVMQCGMCSIPKLYATVRRVLVQSTLASYSQMRGVSQLSACPLSDKTSSRVHGVVSCFVMSCSTQIAVLWAGVELAQRQMTFVTPILVSSLGGARAPVAQAGAKRPDVIWDEWEVFDHSTPIWAYLLCRYCTADSGINDIPRAMGHVCVCAHTYANA